MIRRAFLKCCVSAALAVGAFYGGMGLPKFSPAEPLNAFSEFEEMIQTALSPSVRSVMDSGDDPVWKVIQNFKGGESWAYIDGELMCLSHP